MSSAAYINRSQLSDVYDCLSREQWTTFVLDGSAIRDKRTLFDQFIRSLPQDPSLVGTPNWDAFVDSVWAGILEQGLERVAVIWNEAQTLEAADNATFKMALKCFADIGHGLAHPGPGGASTVTLKLLLVGDYPVDDEPKLAPD